MWHLTVVAFIYTGAVRVICTTGSTEAEYCSCNPVINVNKACGSDHGHTDVQTTLPVEDVKQMFTDISKKILDEYETRFSKFLGTFDINAKPSDCDDIHQLGYHSTGVYTIHPQGVQEVPVRCDMDTNGGGWTVIQRRVSSSDFYKGWSDYQIGFGDLNSNFWLGNEQIHAITSQGWYGLRVDMTGPDGIEQRYAEYNKFAVGDAESTYTLVVDGYNGNAGDSMKLCNGVKFSTKDRDHDNSKGNCATQYMGGWWYDNCHSCNPNGVYGSTNHGQGVNWIDATTLSTSLVKVEMKVRRWRKVAINGESSP